MLALVHAERQPTAYCMCVSRSCNHHVYGSHPKPATAHSTTVHAPSGTVKSDAHHEWWHLSRLYCVLRGSQDPDVTIRKRAMDLLFTMCNASNAEVVVDELIRYLVTADFSLREELVLKIAILAEKFAPSVQWCVRALYGAGWVLCLRRVVLMVMGEP